MRTDFDQISRLIQNGEIDELRKTIDELNSLIRGDYEHLLHRSFQIQRGSCEVPPNKEVMEILASLDLIAPIFRGIYTQDMALMAETIRQDPASLERRDACTCTPFLRAAETCKIETLDLLAREGADVFATREDGFGALHLAAWNEVHPQERIDTIDTLVALGCQVDALTKDDATPLMLAAMCFKDNSVKRLLEHGADPGLKSNENRTALDYAKASKHQPSIDLLS